jgi:hypothetical protein
MTSDGGTRRCDQCCDLSARAWSAPADGGVAIALIPRADSTGETMCRPPDRIPRAIVVEATESRWTASDADLRSGARDRPIRSLWTLTNRSA